MIPVRLEMRDFLSYGTPGPIDFTRFDVACLTGDNGVGKSSILDAMTYALFGAARGCENGQNQERLIREGAEECVVDFTFELNAQTYQIVRRRKRPKAKERAAKGNEVRFEVLTDDGWTNIAKDTIRETDRHIENVLRMDYRTFVNSAFFLQGRADEFLAAMGPDERKEVFARLLDLGTYGRLEDAARLRARDAERIRAELAAQAQRLTEAAQDPGDVEAELQDATRRAADARASLQQAVAAESEARERRAGLEREAAVIESERAALAELEHGVESLRAAAERRAAELEQTDALLARTDEVAEALDAIERLREAEAKARGDAARAAELREQVSALTERVRAERNAIDLRCKERAKTISALTQERKSLDSAERDLAKALTALADSASVGDEVDANAKELEDQRAREASSRDAVAACAAKTGEIKEKLDLLKTDEATCPLCGGPLDATHRRDLTATLRTAGKKLTSDRKLLDAERERCAKEIRRLSEESARLLRVQRDRSTLEGAVGGLEAKRDRLAAVLSEIKTLDGEGALDARLLESGEFAAEQRLQIEELTERIGRLYDEAEHVTITNKLTELRSYEQLHGRLEEAASRRPVVQRELWEARERVDEASTNVDARRKALAPLGTKTEEISDASAALLICEQQTAERREHAAAAETLVARLHERLESVRRLRAEAASAREGEARAAEVHRRYEALVRAFGRNGIPERIIRNAVPELENEANDILGRLSDYEMRLQFQFEWETRSGKPKGTFDVLVSHDGGVRDFRMFSGGEAFRIAFAVRLGLSKLLVRRAGARLETLVLDEGFGTQDPAGRERLIEAIDLARHEFAKVLVITHLDEMKGTFGVQIRVSKDPVEGSRLEICS